MAGDFCNCINKDSTREFGEHYSACVDSVLTMNKKELSRLGIERTDFSTYSKMIQDFLSQSRMEKSCPTFYPRFMTEFEAAKKMSSIEHKFSGRFQSKQKIGKNFYIVELKDSKDSLRQFFCNDPLKLDEIHVGQSVSVIYNQTGKDQFFIKSISKN